MASETVVYTPEQTGGTVPAWMAMNNGGLFGNGNGWGGGILGFLLGLWFGNGGWGNGFGGFGGGAGAGAGFLSNQINNDSGRELLMNAITSQGEASRTAIGNLSTMLGQDFNLVNSGVSAIRDGIATLAAQTGMSSLQIINAIQSGNSDLASRLCQCCCENKLLITSQGYENQIATLNQTNTLGTAISGSGQRTVDAIADLKTTMVKEFCDAKERDMQEKIDGLLATNSALRGQIDNAQQTAAITGYINSLISPLQKDVDDIKCKQPSTVSVQYPNLVALNATPYVSGGYYQGGFNGLYGAGLPGFGGGITF
ncbi:MAG: hypothetical protein II661_06215 [Bacteroidales bacterium]|nr:hypothetical protein [Bacteroidales bacterium]